MNVRYRVALSQAERDELTAMLGGGKHAARHFHELEGKVRAGEMTPAAAAHELGRLAGIKA